MQYDDFERFLRTIGRSPTPLPDNSTLDGCRGIFFFPPLIFMCPYVWITESTSNYVKKIQRDSHMICTYLLDSETCRRIVMLSHACAGPRMYVNTTHHQLLEKRPRQFESSVLRSRTYLACCTHLPPPFTAQNLTTVGILHAVGNFFTDPSHRHHAET